MACALFILYVVFTLLVLYHGQKTIVWEIGTFIYLMLATFVVGLHWFLAILLWLAVIAIDFVLRSEALRLWISDYLYQHGGKSIPKLSKTEEEALNAGDTWLEQSIFTGAVDWDQVHHIQPKLTEEEQQFLQEETQTLCDMLDEWHISQTHDLPKKAWDFMKEKGFFAIVIAKEYGGKGFSAYAHSEIVMKLATRCSVAAVTVMVPNSLGPGELLQHYGTEEQKNYYLPRLAKGQDIPCFALTEPGAGSDATSIKSQAIVVKKKVAGEEILGLELTLNKRWITLSPIATLIGLAVDLKDPNGLLEGQGEEGITCLLISRDIDKLEIGHRHLPADQPFMNGTIRGEGIFVPISSIIGGQTQAGQGWKMLVECLSIGRSISLPALAAASSSVSYLTSGAFARIRRQFNVEIAHFEGIEEKLAEIAGLTYLVNSTRILTAAAVDAHKKPSVASAITKYFNTELARLVVNHAMDVHAGRAVVVGPRNYMSSFYQGIPISVTVEGANIMSRNLLIFGQGSIACHPFLRQEFYALKQEDKQAFHQLIWQHIHYFMQNMAKAVCTAWTAGLFTTTPKTRLASEHQQFTRLTYAYAWLADLSLIKLGGSLKRKERLSARLADGMSYLYLAMGALRHADLHQEEADVQLHAKWAVKYCFYQAQKSLLALCQNFPSRILGFCIRVLVFPFGQTMRYPSDQLDQQLAKVMAQNNQYRHKLTQSVYLSGDANQPVDRMEIAFQAIINHIDLYKKIGDLKAFKFGSLKEKLIEKVKQGDISQTEMDNLLDVERLRWNAIQVDEFGFDDMKKKTFNSLTSSEAPF